MSPDLGLVVRVHKVTVAGVLNWLAAAALGAVACPFLLHFAATTHGPALKSAIGGVLTGAMTLWALAEAYRLRRLSLTVHELGMSLRQGDADSVVRWTDVMTLEARYVPGFRKRGVQDEGNCVSFLVQSLKGPRLELPKELESFAELRSLIEARSPRAARRVLIQNLTQR